ncbi:DNA polymerase IV [uncultured Paenalcaligenes sp.]|uniref:DNA polymerase IV n=1 Tax=uncultured Paenalcaligenes sp. TaxID=1588925 RepID=UPI002632DD10|nr:DNA polymerase IV [uncultured Paenalcaligenes sp.]
MISMRRIAHLDMDAFYASVELLYYPELIGKVVVIGGRNIDKPRQLSDGSWHYARLGDYVGRGVVTTASYEARALGVFSAMGLMKAAQYAPDAYLLPANFNAYRHYSRLFKQAVARISDRIENRGIDEIYIDLSHLDQDSAQLACLLQQAVFNATGLTCSIGISPNKLLSKIASDLHKPNGVCILDESDVSRVIWPLAVSKVNGIGPKSQRKLADLDIHTVGDIAAADPAVLQQHFGLSYAQWLKEAAQGIDSRPVVLSSEPKSISRERTFSRDLHVGRDRNELSRMLQAICEQLEQDLRHKGYRAQTIGIKLRFDDFSILTRDITVDAPVVAAAELIHYARQNLRRTQIRHRKLRLIGVRAAKLMAEADCEAMDSQPVQLALGDFL